MKISKENMQSRHQKSIQYALDVLQSSPFRKKIEAVYLYGSCARGTQKYTSDVDILVQHTKELAKEEARKLRIIIMPDQLDLPEVDVKFVKGDNWKTSNDPFSKNLMKEGTLLWKKK